MPALSPEDARLLPLEGKRIGNTNTARIPEEYLQLLLPSATIHCWQQGQVYILSQHIILGPYSLWIHDVISNGEQHILPYVPHAFYTLHFLFESGLNVRLPDASPYHLAEDTCNLFYLEPGISQLPLEEDAKALSVNINILPEYMPALTADFPELNKRILQNRTGYQVLNKQPFPVSALSRLLISKILTCRYLVTYAGVFLERCCADLFRLFCRQYKGTIVISPADNRKYDQVFDYMRNNPHLHFDLHDLCWKFRISETEMEAGFLAHFSIPIKECHHMLKMITAFDMIVQQTYKPGEIAVKVGLSTEELISEVEGFYGFKVAANGN
ncbi:hypothetical protein [Chitinophaga rhizophila]|uniref:HTH araC/xylS-type domain-containing protein n=1 Tax=Chitinophaga rhizophila TaxID=2866212 RepID=A0ABS7GN24_9BACT|nr:hypothetical protein [Chitinophaga rhizophila]MBW8688168.1 hypothetical protein [Chitinophaga rhizophila]